MAIRVQTSTVWRYLGEDASGAVQWKTEEYPGYFGFSRVRDASSSMKGPLEKLSGFLFPAEVRMDHAAKDENNSFGLSGRDRIAVGAFSACQDPLCAEKEGAKIFVLTYAARPPHISDGTLAGWCEVQGVRTVRSLDVKR